MLQEEEEDDKRLWKVECAELKLMNLFGDKGEMKSTQFPLTYLTNHREEAFSKFLCKARSSLFFYFTTGVS